jgi:magnesium transporter
MADSDAARDLLEDARELIAGEEWAKLFAIVGSLHPADITELALLLEGDERREFVDHLPRQVLGQMFEFAEGGEFEDLVRTTSLEALPEALAEVDDDVVADVLQELEPEERADTLAALGRSEQLEDLLEYQEESAGGIMSRGFVALQETLTVQQAIDYLRAAKPSSAQTYYLFVVDSAQRLIGNVGIRDLLVSLPRTPLLSITNRDIHRVTTETDQEEVARTLQRYNLLAVPVVNADDELVGVTLAEDIIDVISEEATEDMYRMVGLDEEETAATPIRRTIRLRLPWLLVNLFTASIGGFVVSRFDSTLEQAVVLAAFMPIVANQSGVTGTQSATIAVRTMALRGSVRGTWRQSGRELAVGLANGFVVGVVLAIVGYAFSSNGTLALILLATMTISSALATLVGQLVPVLLRSLGADPALASSIFVTMMTDALSFLLLLGTGAVLIDRVS